MKIIIISDIQGQAKSIIPYGLRMGRATEVDVDILHTIDPRKTQGTSSPYADSQSITPGEKLPHEKIILREMQKAHIALQKYISGEGSRLNYPLKINLVIESDSLEKIIKSITDRHPESMLIANFRPANSMVDDLGELLSLAMKIQVPTFFIPPGHTFKKLRSCMLFTDFHQNSYASLSKVMQWLKSFDLMIHAFGMAGKDDPGAKVDVSSTWKREVLPYIESPMKLKTTLISNGDPFTQFVDYIKRNKAELILIPRYMIGNHSEYQLSMGLFKKAMKEISLPVAIF